MKRSYDIPKNIQDALFTLEEYFESDLGIKIEMCDGFYTVELTNYCYQDEENGIPYTNSYVVDIREFFRDYTEDDEKKIVERR